MIMAREKIRIQRPKSRRRWEINPATRVDDEGSYYQRPAEKEKERELVFGESDSPQGLLKGRILGIDYGQRRVGLAVSDPLGITAQGLETFETDNTEKLVAHLQKIIAEYAVEQIIVGLPLNLDGSRGEQAIAVERFMEVLKSRFGLPVVPWDERMSTMAAERAMHEMGGKAKGQKGKVDRIAAVLILQSYLDRVF
jgi:putative Holliday junction resolvase